MRDIADHVLELAGVINLVCINHQAVVQAFFGHKVQAGIALFSFGLPVSEYESDLVIGIGEILNPVNRAGIVADSDPDKEYQETINKAMALFHAIQDKGTVE